MAVPKLRGVENTVPLACSPGSKPVPETTTVSPISGVGSLIVSSGPPGAVVVGPATVVVAPATLVVAASMVVVVAPASVVVAAGSVVVAPAAVVVVSPTTVVVVSPTRVVGPATVVGSFDNVLGVTTVVGAAVVVTAVVGALVAVVDGAHAPTGETLNGDSSICDVAIVERATGRRRPRSL